MSPGLARDERLAAADVPFGKAAALLADLAGIRRDRQDRLLLLRRGVRRGRPGGGLLATAVGCCDPCLSHDPPAAPASPGP